MIALRESALELSRDVGVASGAMIAAETAEKEPAGTPRPGREALHRMHRSAHTAKGLVGFLGVPEMDRLAAGLAETLRRLRDGEAELTRSSVQRVLETRGLGHRLSDVFYAQPKSPWITSTSHDVD